MNDELFLIIISPLVTQIAPPSICAVFFSNMLLFIITLSLESDSTIIAPPHLSELFKVNLQFSTNPSFSNTNAPPLIALFLIKWHFKMLAFPFTYRPPPFPKLLSPCWKVNPSNQQSPLPQDIAQLMHYSINYYVLSGINESFLSISPSSITLKISGFDFELFV